MILTKNFELRDEKTIFSRYLKSARKESDDSFIAALGIFREDDSLFIGLVQEIERVAEYSDIYRIKKVKLVGIGCRSVSFETRFYEFFDHANIYYSASGDLTLSHQMQLSGAGTRDEYLWNSVPLRQLEQEWPGFAPTVKVICGFVEEAAPFTLISRKSRFNAGVHNWNRGADENGHVANFVETEEIYEKQDSVVSFVQIRGTVPLFWSQHPTGQITRAFRYGPRDESARRFNLHFSELVAAYGTELVLAVLTNRRGKEKKMTEEYEILARDFGLDFRQFPLNEEAKIPGKIAHSVSKFRDAADFCVSKRGILKRHQRKFIRTSCASSLDRTNVFQTMLSTLVMDDNGAPAKQANRYEMWAHHANALARVYAGSGAQKTTVPEIGYQTPAQRRIDFMTNVHRYINSFIVEGRMDDSINILTQERPIRSYRTQNVLIWFIMLVFMLVRVVLITITKGRKEGALAWRKGFREVIDHPHYKDLRDADEYI